MSESCLEVNNLTVTRTYVPVIEDFAFSIKPGELLRLAGKNGAGKTTVLRSIAGLVTPDGGQFKWCGRSIDSPHLYTDEVVFIGHKNAIRTHLTVKENLMWFLDLQKKTLAGDEQLTSVLNHVGLSGMEREIGSNLSAGQRRRLSLARLFLLDAKLWLLDEPFNAIDVEGVGSFAAQIETVLQSGSAVIYSAHQPVDFPTRVARVLDLDAVDA